ncbi:MAG: hypothetical protein R3C58_10015 [Parvularculaceae bacterium]
MSSGLASKFRENDYAIIRNAAPAEVARNFLSVIHGSMVRYPGGLERFVLKEPRVNTRQGYEFYGYRLPMVMTFHWAMTSRISEIVGRPLLPTFVFFRVYMQGDRLLVHSDRQSCEYALTLSLGYSDDEIWPLEIGDISHRYEEIANDPKRDDFGGEPYSTVMLEPGDAMLYRGVNRRHARMTPNPNKWSAHLFLFWVDAEGPFQNFAFDQKTFDDGVDFPGI